MYDFYKNTYCGTAISEEEFPELIARAEDKLTCYERLYRVSGDETMRRMALCAMAEAIGYFDAAQNGQGGLRYASVGTVSVSGKGIYSQVDISPAAQEKELYRAAALYLTIYRGTSRC
jgi:hypothetical protein